MTRARPNGVQWASNVLRAAYDVILAKLGPDWFPVDQDGEWDEAGCGAFGCVFQTGIPGVVCKVTIDGSEAMLADLCMKKGWRLPGLPTWTGQVLHVAEPAPAWIIWRNDLPGKTLNTVVGRAFCLLTDRLSLHAAEASFYDNIRASGSEDARHLEEAQQCGLAVSSYVVHAVLDGPPMAGVLEDFASTVDWAKLYFKPEKKHSYWLYWDKRLELTLEQSAAFRLLGYEWHINQALEGTLAPELASSLLVLMKNGLLLCDCSTDNIDGEAIPVTLRDCGFCLPIRAKWLGEWEKSRADMFAWWSPDTRMRWMDAWERWRS